MDIVISVLLVIVVILMVFLLRKKEVMADIDTPIKTLEEAFKNELKTNREEINTIAKENRKELNDSIQVLEKSLTETVDKKFNQQQEKQKQLNQESSTIIKEKFSDFNQQQAQFNQQATDNIKHIEKTVGTQLTNIREESSKKLEQMRQTVDEKLQSTLERRLGESFKQVSERLEQVHIGLGEMKSVANDVGDLKKVLSNVKTRGTLGEYQLGAILEQMLSPEQYACNVATKKGSQANVEFAVKLPGKSEGEVWIPIDAKYPREDYERLINAYELGDKIKIEEFQKKVLKSIELFAKEIASKYIDPPHTTDFAVMYLPDEGLYAEVLRHVSLFEKLQRQYKITVTGPTTLSAFLNSLQMGFKTLAIQKRSAEVWDVLTEVKTEFTTFSSVFEQVQKQLNTASGTLEKLRTTRSNVLERKLKKVELLDNKQSTLPMDES
ncbi:DNA recombination protein RmuC [uncultured Gammaproteobacteria bacterium]|jgi:DNA recombination protein RmuC|nr:DNA recombination protein RmuC [uncultured Gammaproteobacteria bacterium]CAC9563970.1 DNA recombination protein RmuC [uncultured Gammaproteobacteria bacterium]CAC9577381.1 DNA recombination protein RmuC [uncultured Gammaproteobacteria bacterium]CAC9580117.1 DNA recombination protein RmuC [uncultured Gammaproteobacteria bacterium]CAC9605647.1 DNA recombination protein RmuC [uncultured Gammaproteobacteria bacterium]